MNIGIISSGNESLALFKFLTTYDHHYFIFHDQTHFPFGTKDVAFILEEIKKEIRFLKIQGAEIIILDPLYELLLLQDEKMKEDILPLFSSYLQQYVFMYSLVGKLGILTDVASKEIAQEVIASAATTYVPTENQKAIKKFHFPFAYRVKSVSARSFGIGDLGIHNPYLIRTLKNDLRYFKDALVDTIIPLHYHYFRMQRTIKGFFNFNKIRFHDLSVVEECFKKLIAPRHCEGEAKHTTEANHYTSPLDCHTRGSGLAMTYSIKIWTNQDPKFLLKEKELVWLLQRGKGVKLQIERI